MGAALAFYTVFSLAPLAILILTLVSLVVERNLARAEMVDQFRSLVGKEGADMVEMILTRTAEAHTSASCSSALQACLVNCRTP
jgi:membrane protein